MQGSMALSIAALQGWFFFIPRMFFFYPVRLHSNVITNYVLFIGLRICSYDIVIEKKNRAVTMFRLTSMHDSFFFSKHQITVFSIRIIVHIIVFPGKGRNT
jgi:hypothetical protein